MSGGFFGKLGGRGGLQFSKPRWDMLASFGGTDLGISNASTAPFKSIQHGIDDLNALQADTVQIKRQNLLSRTLIYCSVGGFAPVMCSKMLFHHIWSGWTLISELHWAY